MPGANHIANFDASDVTSRDYHPVANPVAKPLLNVLLSEKTCFLGAVTGLSGRRPNLCGCVCLAVVAGLLIRRSGCRARQRGDAGASPDCFSGLHQPACGLSLRLSLSYLVSFAPLILTLAMCGPRERYGKVSIGEGETLSVVEAVGDGVAGVGFAAMTRAL